jgi:transcriptional regulator with XRE-family HTH domain
MKHTPPSFFVWLQKELDQKDLTMATLSKRGGFSASSLTVAKKGSKRLGIEVTNAIAKVLNKEPYEVAVRAGLLPPAKNKVEFENIMQEMVSSQTELQEMLSELDADDLEALERIGRKARAMREQRFG